MSSKEKIEASLVWAPPGHYFEYVLVIYTELDFYMKKAQRIEEILGEDWDISDRGDRIEIVNRNDIHFRDDKKIKVAVQKALGRRFSLSVRL